jgi:hypothetical protein
MSGPAQLERMSRLLARRLEETGSRGDAVSVADFQRRLLPYHLCRDELGLTTKAEYDGLVLELIGESGRIRVNEPLLSTAIRKERASPEPGLAFLRRFADSRLQLLDRFIDDSVEAVPEAPGSPVGEVPTPDAPSAVGQPESEVPRPSANRPSAARSAASRQTGRRSAPTRARTPGRPRPGPSRPAEASFSGRRCWGCARALPERQGLRYCPHCGVDQTFRPCGDCEAELELSWAYCPICGASVS